MGPPSAAHGPPVCTNRRARRRGMWQQRAQTEEGKTPTQGRNAGEEHAEGDGTSAGGGGGRGCELFWRPGGWGAGAIPMVTEHGRRRPPEVVVGSQEGRSASPLLMSRCTPQHDQRCVDFSASISGGPGSSSDQPLLFALSLKPQLLLFSCTHPKTHKATRMQTERWGFVLCWYVITAVIRHTTQMPGCLACGNSKTDRGVCVCAHYMLRVLRTCAAVGFAPACSGSSSKPPWGLPAALLVGAVAVPAGPTPWCPWVLPGP